MLWVLANVSGAMMIVVMMRREKLKVGHFLNAVSSKLMLFGLTRDVVHLMLLGGKITELDADEDVTLVDVDTAVEMDADTKGRMEEDVTAVKEINAAESKPTVFDDEEVTMTMMKAEKARLLDEQMAKRLQDDGIEQAAARERYEKEDLEKAKVLEQQYDQKQENIDWNVVVEQMQEKHLDNIKKYQS
nr:hypothetical protein [Tanacetum cinerariifolium]